MILTVSELTSGIKKTLEQSYSAVSVIGEISNFKHHNSGHWYFNLKDSSASIYCAMWRGYNNYVFFTPQDGMKVIVSGKITVYPPKGNYQIDVRSMKPAGAGELQAAFELLKQKLSEEGLFAEEYKKPIPALPRKIGIVTAPDGAALKDMVNICKRRFPLVNLVVAPARVQGSGAADSIAEALRLLNLRNDCDVIIVARGGGSIEDLWAFNEEKTARAVFESEVPVITGIGHETDFTICDFAADMRAPTPSAAMEIATPDQRDFYTYINSYVEDSTEYVKEICRKNREEVQRILQSYGFRRPLENLKNKVHLINEFIYRITKNMNHNIMLKNHLLSLLSSRVESHDIQRTLKKGFVLVKQGGKFVTRSLNFDEGKKAVLSFFDGEIIVEQQNQKVK